MTPAGQRGRLEAARSPFPITAAEGGDADEAGPTQLNTDDFNRRVISAHARPGQGLFIAALRRQLRHRGLDLPFDEHDLIAEITR